MTRPPRLYKYRSLAEAAFKYTEQIFLRDEIYFSPLGSLNDPFEGRHHQFIHSMNDPVMLDPVVQEMMGDIYRRAQESAARIVAGVGVLSLSEKPDESVMWSHYADEHRGICLEFDGSNLGTLFDDARRVDYSDSTPFIDVTGDPSSLELAKLICLSKASQWQYEKEWRVLSPVAGVKPFPSATLTGVILGARISADHRRCVRDWLAQRSPQPQILQAELEDRNYGLGIHPAY